MTLDPPFAYWRRIACFAVRRLIVRFKQQNLNEPRKLLGKNLPGTSAILFFVFFFGRVGKWHLNRENISNDKGGCPSWGFEVSITNPWNVSQSHLDDSFSNRRCRVIDVDELRDGRLERYRSINYQWKIRRIKRTKLSNEWRSFLFESG